MALILASFAMGIHSERMRHLTDQEIIDETMKHVATIHDKPVAFLKSELVRGIVKKYGDDPYAGAALPLGFPYHVSVCVIQYYLKFIMYLLVFSPS